MAVERSIFGMEMCECVCGQCSTLERYARGTVCVGEWVLSVDVGMYVGCCVFDIRMYVGSEQRVVVVWPLLR